MQHANQFRTFFVDRRCVEIVDRLILSRFDRMRRGSGVFPELGVAQHRHVFDPLDCCGMKISREALIAEDGETFLEGELKPVAAGDAVTAPVVEIFVSDHALDPLQLGVRGRFGISQHQLRIEDIETLVLHCAHVEVAHRDDVVFVEVVFELIHLLIPGHGALQRLHRVGGVRLISRLHMQTQRHHTPGCRGELIADLPQFARHEGEQIRRFGEGVLPGDGMAPIAKILFGDGVAIAQQHGATGP